MDKKKILIVSRSFYPTISPRAFRATELAKEFVHQGNIVNVLTCFQPDTDYNKLTKYFGINFKDLGRERFKIFRLQGVKPVILFKRLINRMLLMLIEFPDIQLMRLTVKALRNESNYDQLVSIAVPYPIHWGVAWARKPKHRIAKVWIADCGDPYMGDRIDTFRKLFYFKYIEKWFCRKADYITIPIIEGIKGYYEEFHYKIRIIPQGFNFKEITLPAWKGDNRPIKFAYAGNIIPVNRDPRPFLNYLCSIDQDFIFYIFTKKIGLIENFKITLKEKLEIRDYIPRDELLPHLASMDFLVNFDNNTSIHSPSKLIDYALTGRPILNVTSQLDKSIIAAFLNHDYSNAFIINDLEQYNISNIVEELLKLV